MRSKHIPEIKKILKQLKALIRDPDLTSGEQESLMDAEEYVQEVLSSLKCEE